MWQGSACTYGCATVDYRLKNNYDMFYRYTCAIPKYTPLLKLLSNIHT